MGSTRLTRRSLLSLVGAIAGPGSLRAVGGEAILERHLKLLVCARVVVEVGKGHAGQPLADRTLDGAQVVFLAG